MLLMCLLGLPIGANGQVQDAARVAGAMVSIGLLLLALRFGNMRAALAGITLSAITGALWTWTPAPAVFVWTATATAVNLAFVSLVEEQRIDPEITALWLLWTAVQAAALFALMKFLPQSLVPVRLPGDVLLNAVICLASFGLVAMAAAFKRDPVTIGFAWAQLPLAAIAYGGAGRPAMFTVASLALALALVERSYWIAYFDELTGLRGRRALNEAFQSLRGGYCIAVVDVDHFKSFNDSFGHDNGDDVLRKVASHLARTKGGAQAFRCGGEEFLLLFRGKTGAQALRHCEALREAIEGDPFVVRGPDRSGRDREERRRKKNSRTTAAESRLITVSVGLAEAPVGFSPQQVYKAADRALYRAKGNGRNRVEVARGGTQRKPEFAESRALEEAP